MDVKAGARFGADLQTAHIERIAAPDERLRERHAQARRALTEAQGRVTRLLQLVEAGAMDIDDPALRERLVAAKEARRAAQQEVELTARTSRAEKSAITPEKIERLATVIRDALRSDDPGFRKAYLRLFVGKIVVNDSEIRISGPTAALEQAASAGGLPTSTALVPSFVRGWYPVGDSNPCYRRERAVS